ncbi:MAG: MFS transporter [Marinomonas foliarum]|uniref:MFS transporter n=1 Tax=Marinomonas foliarum TaxID=491950 RepID=A0A368ZT02_9GAMM|nr:MFS transporter [Marinomonas foliarum]QRV22735.1 MFS transporter [Marinomonas foliarum]RCW97931.1 MHS family proline/betaine transporter-like MFS transporter [Marinomonas foliarum]
MSDTYNVGSVEASTKKPADKKLLKLIVASSIGNALEWFDLIVYAFFASTISKLFFPTDNETLSLMLALFAFAMSYLIRPIGAIVIGGYADKVGRKAAMLLTIWLMMAGTFLIAVMPTYETIGLLAPLGILLARLLQGFSAGGEFGSATAMLVEHYPERKGFISSFMFASQGLSGLLGAGFGLLLTTTLTTGQLESWGWRIPFFFGLLIGPVGLYIRRHIEETTEFTESKEEKIPLIELFANNKLGILFNIGAMILSTSVTYSIIFMPTYATKYLGLSNSIGYGGTLISYTVLMFLTPFVGILSDRIGRTRLMIGAGVLFFLTVWPAFFILSTQPTLIMLASVLFWLSVLKSMYFGGLPALMSEMFPTRVRATGMALSYNISTTLFGSFTPFLLVWSISASGDQLAPSYYLLFTSFVSLLALFGIRRHFKIN